MNGSETSNFNITSPEYKIEIENFLTMEVILDQVTSQQAVDLCYFAHNEKEDISIYQFVSNNFNIFRFD